MAKIFTALLFSLCAVSVCSGWFFGPNRNRCNPFWSSQDYKTCTPCTLFKTKTVNLRVRNVLREPTFEETVSINCSHSKTLIYFMQEAAEANSLFRFSAKYFNFELGYYVEAINGVVGNWTLDQTWWQILDGDMQMTPVGVSSYEPKSGETVTFNFTQGSGH